MQNEKVPKIHGSDFFQALLLLWSDVWVQQKGIWHKEKVIRPQYQMQQRMEMSKHKTGKEFMDEINILLFCESTWLFTFKYKDCDMPT